MTVVVAAVLGLLCGLHAASWGAYKDSPYEGFRWKSYLRSILLGGAVAVVICAASPLDTTTSPVVLIGLFYVSERLATEWWKAILREDDQSSYTIPMRLGHRGRPVDRRLVRYGIGAAVVLGLATACAIGAVVQPGLQDVPPAGQAILGGIGGWFTALGGAWKDAPIEGFSGWKLLRSPAVATVWAWPLSLLTDNLVVLAFSAAGFAGATIETYKTFLTGDHPPGKFATKPVLFALPTARRVLAGISGGAWAALAACLLARVLLPLRLPPALDLAAETTSASADLAAVLVAVMSTIAAALVLGSGLRGSPIEE